MIRLLTRLDLRDLMALSSAAGWNQTQEDWQMLLDLAPRGCWGVEADDRVVSSATLLCYGRRAAWVGMVLTLPEYRGRGFARSLLAEALHSTRELGIQTVKLDATDSGRPLYESLGFRVEQPIERWSRPGETVSSVASPAPIPAALDHRACGYDRAALLSRLSERSRVVATPTAYGMVRSGRVSTYIGPCIAESAGEAARIIGALIDQQPEASYFWDLFPGYAQAAALAGSLGFQPARRLLRMSLGEDLRGAGENIYAIAGFELG